jgi:repressor LexA
MNSSSQTLRVTGRQLELLRAIRRWSAEYGRMPSVRELGEILGKSASTIHQHLSALERRGCLTRSGETHGLTLLVDDKQLGLEELGAAILLPLKGVIEPGRSLNRYRPPYRRIGIGGGALSGDYLLQVGGNRLETEGIFDGDLLVVRPGPATGYPAVLVFIDGTADVKRIGTLPDGTLVLYPPHPRLDRRRGRRQSSPMVVQGKVLRVIRRFEALE